MSLPRNNTLENLEANAVEVHNVSEIGAGHRPTNGLGKPPVPNTLSTTHMLAVNAAGSILEGPESPKSPDPALTAKPAAPGPAIRSVGPAANGAVSTSAVHVTSNARVLSAGGNGGGSSQLSVLGPMVGPSMHGADAARRQAITELLFFASVGDLLRCQRLVKHFALDITDPKCCDYDFRTPLHLAASEGAFSIVKWLLDTRASVNAVDRFKRTPLEDAVRGDHKEVVQLLLECGGRVLNDKNELVDITRSRLAGAFRVTDFATDDWEVDPTDLDIRQKLGEGEFGTVHLAFWHGTVVAVKILRKSDDVALGDFKTELNILMKVHHPHTVQFMGACTKQQPYMLITEFLPGGSLADLFRLGKRLPLRRGVEIAMDTARGLAYMHCRKPQAIIHRDLKPANLMIGGNPYKADVKGFRERLMFETGLIKIADFGLSKSLALNVRRNRQRAYFEMMQGIAEDPSDGGIKPDDSCPLPGQGQSNNGAPPPPPGPSSPPTVSANGVDSNQPKLNQRFRMTGETGSYRFMAPEVFRHEPYNNKVDVYSFAMIMYQLFENCPPFYGMDPIEAARCAATEHARPMFVVGADGNTTPEPVRKLISECWDPDPDRRPEFVEIVKRLEDFYVTLPKLESLATGSAGNPACCTLQ